MKDICCSMLLRAALSAALLVSSASAQAPPTGTITGAVLDAQNGQAIRQVTVTVEGVPAKSSVTDLNGRFRLDLSPGTYKLQFRAETHSDTAIDEIVVTGGEVTEASTVMASKTAVTTVDVVEKVNAVAPNAEAMLAERKLSAVVSDAISGEDIKKSTASDAAGALQKVTGVSVVDNGFVYVRGLGERYSATMLNNAMIPTTEPEKRVVPLDLFPAALIDNIKILKTYTPDLPGEFSGGLVQMSTVDFPTQKILRVSASYGFNTVTTFDRFGSYRGGSRDFFGFGKDSRALPSAIPATGRIFPGNYSDQEIQSFGRALENSWDPTYIDSMRPQQSYSIVGGNTFGRIGLVAALTFTNKPQVFNETQNYLTVGGAGRPIIFTNYPDFNANMESAKLGGVLNAAVKINGSNKLLFRNTLTRDSDKEARSFTGYNGGIDGVINATRLRYIERGLFSTSVEGEHAATKLGNTLFKWQFTYSSSQRDEPDLREVVRGQLADGRFSYLALPQSGLRFFNNLEDRIYEPLAEVSRPFYKGKVVGLWKAGFRGTFRSRDFSARRFRFVPVRSTTLNFFQPSNELFGPSNIRPDGFALRENTRATDTYAANMDVYAGFGMLDVAIGSRWRVVGGFRVEDADIQVNTIDPLIPGGQPSNANLTNRDVLPGVNVIYALTSRQNLRAGYGRTVSRPDFRELSPFDFTNVLGGFNIVGNPNLVRATIDNIDVRWEWFPTGDQVVAASYFYKRFTNPIEVTIQPTTDLRQSFLNADGARNQGIELEFRRSLRFVSPKLASLIVQSNFTFVDSNVQIPAAQAALLTSKSRPLVGQSRFIYNAILEWVKPKWRSNFRFYANTVSRRITDVGTFGLPDIYQERNTFLDLVYQYEIKEGGKWTLRVAAENLGNNHYHWTQADILQRSYRLGRTFTVGTSYSLF